MDWRVEPLPDGRSPARRRRSPARELSDLVRGVWQRYGGDVLISETAHVDEQRAPCCGKSRRNRNSCCGRACRCAAFCLYPILGMPEWHSPDVWTPMGLWDPVCHREPHGDRLICAPMLGELHAAHRLNRMHKSALANSVHWVPPVEVTQQPRIYTALGGKLAASASSRQGETSWRKKMQI